MIKLRKLTSQLNRRKVFDVLEIEIYGSIHQEGPDCRVCGATTRLCGTESHSVVNTLRLVTYICPACETHRVEMMQGAIVTRDRSANCRQASADYRGEE
jgi:Zn finger protein HypA/HybF involved in hydrogenase expression